jgi:hypothetical protein
VSKRDKLLWLFVGDVLLIGGEPHRVVGVTYEPAAEDDPELGVLRGEPLLSLTLEPPSMTTSTSTPRATFEKSGSSDPETEKE